jgi:hypothetical protein
MKKSLKRDIAMSVAISVMVPLHFAIAGSLTAEAEDARPRLACMVGPANFCAIPIWMSRTQSAVGTVLDTLNAQRRSGGAVLAWASGEWRLTVAQVEPRTGAAGEERRDGRGLSVSRVIARTARRRQTFERAASR